MFAKLRFLLFGGSKQENISVATEDASVPFPNKKGVERITSGTTIKLERITLRSEYEIRSFGDRNAVIMMNRWGLESGPERTPSGHVIRYGYEGTVPKEGTEFFLKTEGQAFELLKGEELLVQGNITANKESHPWFEMPNMSGEAQITIEKDPDLDEDNIFNLDGDVRFFFVFFYKPESV